VVISICLQINPAIQSHQHLTTYHTDIIAEDRHKNVTDISLPMTRLEIALLGTFQVSKEGKRVTQFENAPTQALLIYLVMHPGMLFRREVLADLLWQDQPRSETLHTHRAGHMSVGFP
jgi:DNA-binding response OmpR family regulator